MLGGVEIEGVASFLIVEGFVGAEEDRGHGYIEYLSRILSSKLTKNSQYSIIRSIKESLLLLRLR